MRELPVEDAPLTFYRLNTPVVARRVLRVSQVVLRRSRLVAGVGDAGLSSLATLAVGVYAVRLLDPAALGAYALAFRAMFLCGVVPTQLFFLPSEVLVVASAEADRLRHLRRTLSMGVPVAFVTALAASVWILFAPATVPASAVTAFTVGAMAVAFVSPIQDHIRRMLHAGGRPWGSASVSAIHAAVTTGTLLSCTAIGLPVWWAPLTALAVGNAVSLMWGILLVSAEVPRGAEPRPLVRGHVIRSGKWLLMMGVLEPGTGFVAAALVASFAGAAALGYAEAARVVAQPLTVLSAGIGFVLGPRSVQAARSRDLLVARRTSRLFGKTASLAGAASLLVFGWHWRGNPLTGILPMAYEVHWLVFAYILAHTCDVLSYPYRAEMLGAQKEVSLLRVELAANAVRALFAGIASELHAFALPLGLLGAGSVRVLGTYRSLRTIYTPPEGSLHAQREPTVRTP